MGRDAPSDLDALLTSREREVLELLRLGLTNGQIADRLDISVAGVRYHVSEIIGKLGVRTRYQAAAWPERPPWWLSAAAPVGLIWRQAKALAPLKLSSVALIASGGLIAAALAGIGLVLFLLLRDGDSTELLSAAPCPSATTPVATDEAGELTLEQLTDRVAEAFTCPGYALHLRSAGQFEAGPYRFYAEGDVWIDAERNQARAESLSIPNSQELRQAADEEGRELGELRSVTILRSDGLYLAELAPENQAARRIRPPGCHGPDHAVLVFVLPCEDLPEEMEITIEQDVTYRGRNAIAYISTGISSGSDETYDTTGRLFLDPSTLLPLGLTVDGTVDSGDVYPVYSDIAYQAQFVRLDSLPPDLFDPASIGYVAVDPEELLDRQEFAAPVYWLGRDFGGGDGLPALAFEAVASEGLPRPEILYRRADDEFESRTVVLVLYSRKQWEALPPRLRGRCVQSRDLALADRQATIYSDNDDELADPPSEACPPPNRVTAIVLMSDAVIEIRAPDVYSGSEYTESPYNSETAMELLIRSLTPRR